LEVKRMTNTETGELPRYDRRQSYDWNYDHAPEPQTVSIAKVPGEWRFLGKPIGSPLGVAAGPLLNGRWVLYYASLGFDVLTYKTVRSRSHPCYPLPNLQPVRCGMLTGGEERLPAQAEMTGSWAVSFGMPSKDPDHWRRDVEWTRRKLSTDKVLSVSVVGTVQPDWGIDELAADYARCAAWAVASGADVIETNFSCPNVATCDGQLYQTPAAAAVVAATVRQAIGATPLVVKVGHLADAAAASALLEALAGVVDAIATTNSIAATVVDEPGALLFDGQRRGICGAATFAASVRQTQQLAQLVAERSLRMQLIGVGGIRTAEHVARYLAAGAAAVHLATAAMVDPAVALQIRAAWPKPGV
jgi:dihydroorotate dehydrogenase